jgi:phage recombination protein Bet
MAQQAITIAPRMTKPAIFSGTDTTWRVLNDLYPAAETPEIIMAVLDYCNVRKLDPFKKPVHIVPMYNSKLRRKVQVVMQGINEVQITAARSKVWAGMDAPVWGPWVTQKFTGATDEESGESKTVTVKYPSSCRVTVYRLVGREKYAFTEELFWEECYARVGFRSAVPNDRWSKAPAQMLHKCTKAAVLRAAFPEDITEMVAEEMEDKETEFGGVTIDGETHRADREQDKQIVDTPEQKQRQRDAQASRATGGAERRVDQANWSSDDPLDELNHLGGDAWLKKLLQLLTAAQTLEGVIAIGGHTTVARSLQVAPTTIKAIINDALKAAHDRLSGVVEGEIDESEPEPSEGGYTDDAPDQATDGVDLSSLLAQIAEMDAKTLAGLGRNAAWRAKMSDLFPPDHAKIVDAVAARKAELEHNT